MTIYKKSTDRLYKLYKSSHYLQKKHTYDGCVGFYRNCVGFNEGLVGFCVGYVENLHKNVGCVGGL
jgi:hypothetical protein